jgi:nucleoside-diphosphate-sugar epimerase
MRVLVTGATGFVGAAAVRALLRRKHKVTGLVRTADRGRAIEAAGAELTIGDMLRPETYAELPQRFDAVIHAAQVTTTGRWTKRKIAAMHAADALMTRTLAKACREHRKLFVYTSGALAHRADAQGWVHEKSPLGGCLLARGHAERVRELADAERRGLNVQIVTPGFVYGAGSFLLQTVDLLKRRRYRVIGDGANWWSLVHVDDLGEGFALAIERGRSGANHFLADDLPLTRRQAVDAIASALGLPPVKSAPPWLVALWLGAPLVQALSTSIRMTNDRVRDELGWRPRYLTFAAGLPSALEEIEALKR